MTRTWTRVKSGLDGRPGYQRVEGCIDEFEVAFGVVSDSSELFIEFDGRSVPFEHLEVDALKSALPGEFRDDTDHSFAKPVPPKIFGDENVFEVITALPAKAGEIWIEHRVSDRRALMKGDEAFDECFGAEHDLHEPMLGYLAIVTEILVFGKVAHKPHDGRHLIGRRFAYLNVHKKAVPGTNSTKHGI